MSALHITPVHELPRVHPPIVKEELAHLLRIRTSLEEEPYQPPPREKDVVAELVRLRDEITGAKEEDKASLMAQYNAHHGLLEQIRTSRSANVEVDPDSPYFAHLQVQEGARVRDVFLGKATRIQEGVRIVDWRNAPISKLFYRYRQGDDYEEEMGGREREGLVLARRTLTIRRGQLLRIKAPEGIYVASDDDGTWETHSADRETLGGGESSASQVYRVGEGLHRRLGTDTRGSAHRTDKRLPDIAGLIDPAQFELITQPSSGFVVIRGTAGSGKTTVALHRIAWLAYQDPSLNSARTLVIVFSRALRDYVSHVLPALGVDRVKVRDYRSWAAELRRQHFPKLPKNHRDDTPSAVVRLKLHPIMDTLLAEQVERVQAPASPEQAIDDWISVLTQPERVQSRLRELHPDAFRDRELERIAEWCRDRYDEILAWQAGERDVPAALDVEDDPLLLRAWQLRVGPLRGPNKQPLRYRHMAIDEVQDFSPLEVQVLLNTLDKSRSITLAGDTQQHVMKDAGFHSWSEFFSHLGIEGTAVNTLKVSYRSSMQIVAFAHALLGELREDEEPPQVTRTGPQVEWFEFTDHGATVAFLADVLEELTRNEPSASVVLLTPNQRLSEAYFDGLRRADVPHLRRVTRQDFRFTPGIEVTEIDQIKGLEFDYVVLIETSANAYPDTPGNRRLLHVGATRAIHQLWLTTVGHMSPIVTEAQAGVSGIVFARDEG